MKDRREFLGTCAAGAALLMAPGYLLAADLPGMQNMQDVDDASKLSKEVFRSLLQEDLYCRTDQGEPFKLKLIEVRDGPQVTGLEQFGLLLQGHGGIAAAQLPAGIYLLDHPRLGTSLVHLEPSDDVPGAYTTQFVLFA